MPKIHKHLEQIALLITLLASFSFQNNSYAQNKSDADAWREDLRYLAEELPRRHNNAFHTMTREQFNQAVKKLDERIPSLAPHEIVVELTRLVAMVGDGHTRLTLPEDPNTSFHQSHTQTPPPGDPNLIFHQYPLRLHLYSDGLFVQAATSEYADAVGDRVVRIGNTSADEAFRIVSEIVHRDNEMSFKFIVPFRLVVPEVIHALHIIDDMQRAPFVLEDRNGNRTTLELKPLERGANVKWIDARDGVDTPTPLWLKNTGNKYWFEFLKEPKTVYLQYNEVQNKQDETIADFSDRVFDFINTHYVDRFVIDIRLNGGGNGYLNQPLIHGLIKCDKINQRGKLFTIIGRQTFSAAMMFAVDLERHTKTLFVGEPTGSTPNHYGDSRKFQLPNSGLTVRASTLYWQNSDPRDTRQWIAPDIAAELSSEDYRTNRDSAVEAIFNYVYQEPLSEILLDTITENGIEAAIKQHHAFKNDPVNAYVDTEQEMNNLGYQLLEMKRNPEAIAIFKLNVDDYPQSFNVYDSLGEAYMLSGDKQLAIRNYKTSIELNPDNSNAVEMLKKLAGN